jgi:hypothetical protein
MQPGRSPRRCWHAGFSAGLAIRLYRSLGVTGTEYQVQFEREA